MGNETKNYKFPKPGENDFYDISEYNKAMDILDETLTEMNDRKLDTDGNGSNVVTEFSQEILRENIESGEKLAVSHGKIKKWFSEMKNIAFSGLAADATQDAAHRFVTDTEKSNWDGKVSASGGDISETVVNTLEPFDAKYPVPAAGESVKRFMGKVLTFLKNVKPLDTNVTYYVATTGSDITGNGTQEKPYKTINKAIDSIPKNLNGHTCTIKVAVGTYNEIVNIIGFTAGIFILTCDFCDPYLCKIQAIQVKHCSARVYAYGFTVLSKDSENDNVSVYCKSCSDVIFERFISTNPDTNTFFFFDTCRFRLEHCHVANKSVVLRAYNSIGVSFNWNEGSSNNQIGLFADYNGIITKVNAQPKADEPEKQYSAGMIINQNGTRISGLITSGLSCTWGTISGGYVRQGNIAGEAMVTVMLRVVATTTLTTGVQYLVSGFPRLLTNYSVVGVATNLPSKVNCFMGESGDLALFVTLSSISVGEAIVFNCTYMTTF